MTLTASDQKIATAPVQGPGMGRYHLITRLARGGMGNVYLAALCRPGGFNKLLALKELKPELAEDENFVAMFLEEARMAARLVHPNIVQTNEIVSEDNRHYMTMEFLDGRSLSRIVRRSPTGGNADEHAAPTAAFPLGAQLRVLADALLGLHYAHELRGFDGEPLGIVHRDVSPLNIMVTFDGQSKVLDFGVAKAVDSSLETKAGVFKGRIAYMAPEQALGAKVDRRADIYSIGVLLWEAAAGRRLWADMSDVEILHRVVGEGPPRLRSVAPDAPEALDALCARAMAKNCEDRYATATQLLADIEAHLAQRDDRMSMRQVGELVSTMFAEERRRMNQIIETALARVSSPRTRSGVMPAFRSSDDLSRPSTSPGEGSVVSDVMACAPGTSSAPPWSDAPSNGSMRCTPVSMSEVKTPGRSFGPSRAPSHAPTDAPPAERRRRVVVVLASALVCVGLAVAIASRLSPPMHGSSAPSESPALAETAAPASPSPTLSITPPSVAEAATIVAAAPPQATAPAVRQAHEAPRALPAPPRGRQTAKPSPPAVAAPPASAPVVETHHPAPAASCDPPFTVDANGIEHFKAGCL